MIKYKKKKKTKLKWSRFSCNMFKSSNILEVNHFEIIYLLVIY